MTAGPPSQMCGWNSALVSAQPCTPPTSWLRPAGLCVVILRAWSWVPAKLKTWWWCFTSTSCCCHHHPAREPKFAPTQKKSSEIATTLAWQSCRTQRGKIFISRGCLTLQNITLLTLCCFPIKTPQCKTAAYFLGWQLYGILHLLLLTWGCIVLKIMSELGGNINIKKTPKGISDWHIQHVNQLDDLSGHYLLLPAVSFFAFIAIVVMTWSISNNIL